MSDAAFDRWARGATIDAGEVTSAEIAAMVRRALAEAGTQTELARRWGVSVAYLHDIVRGHRSAETPRILAALGLRRAIVRDGGLP